MSMNKAFRPDKAVEVILYIISRGCKNLYNILKVIYFADKMRLSMVASTMFKDSYVAFKAGPVPSGAYDLLKDVRDGRKPSYEVELPFAFDSEDAHMVDALRAPKMGCLSKVDIECLDKAIEKYGLMDYWSLKRVSHEQPDYKTVQLNEWIPFDAILASVDKDGKIKDYLASLKEDECCPRA